MILTMKNREKLKEGQFMKTKRTMSLLLAVCMVMSMLCGGAFAAEPDVIIDSTPRPRAVVYNNIISTTDSSFSTDRFTCTNGNGNSLRFWFRNDGEGECVIRLYKVGLFGSSEVKKITVTAGGAPVYEVYSNPGGATFYMTVTCVTGGAISGQLRAAQLDF